MKNEVESSITYLFSFLQIFVGKLYFVGYFIRVGKLYFIGYFLCSRKANFYVIHRQ